MKELKVNINDEDIFELKKIFKTEDEDEAVKMAIGEVLKKQTYERILSLNGNVKWEGSLDEMREQRI